MHHYHIRNTQPQNINKKRENPKWKLVEKKMHKKSIMCPLSQAKNCNGHVSLCRRIYSVNNVFMIDAHQESVISQKTQQKRQIPNNRNIQSVNQCWTCFSFLPIHRTHQKRLDGVHVVPWWVLNLPFISAEKLTLYSVPLYSKILVVCAKWSFWHVLCALTSFD